MRKKKKKKKYGDVNYHFQQRCMLRLGVNMDQTRLAVLLSSGKLIKVTRQSNTKTLFKCPKEAYGAELKKDALLVYDKLRHAFVTAMDYESWVKTHDEDGCRKDATSLDDLFLDDII